MTAPSPDKAKLHVLPPPPKGFDPFAATEHDLQRHGLPRRPDRFKEPEMAALWDRYARRYQKFDHLEPKIEDSPTSRGSKLAELGTSAFDSCGYTLNSTSGPFTALFIRWTVPRLVFVEGVEGLNINLFHTFVGLGLLDVHVDMTVDSSQNVTSVLWANAVGQVMNLPVAPGDALSASLCLDITPPGTAHYFLANETTGQTVNFVVDTGFPPAVTIGAGVTVDLVQNNPFSSLARFGVVYFDEISAYSTGGSQSLIAGQAITMVNASGSTLASPARLNDYAFKVVYDG
jgi:Peptidase A4 family